MEDEPLPGEVASAPEPEAELEAAPEAALELQVEEEPEARPVADGADVATEALEPAVEAPSPARGAVIMSRGIRTRDGDSLLVRFVNHEGWLEARALDCSGGRVGRIVLCGIADDDAAAQRRLCEELAPRLIVRDGTLALGDAPRPALSLIHI